MAQSFAAEISFLSEITGDLTIEINKVYGFAKLAILIIMKIVTFPWRKIDLLKDETSKVGVYNGFVQDVF